MVYKILNKLSLLEYELFRSGLGAGTNSRKIAAMVRRNGEVSRDEMYKRIFKKKRDEQNDVLLRNEISILKRKLEDFILEHSTTDIPNNTAYFRHYVMAQWCLKKSIPEEAEKYLSSAAKQAIQQDSWKGMLQINKLKFQTTQYSKSDYQAKLELLQKLANDHFLYVENFVAYEIRYADYMKAGAFKLASSLRKTNIHFRSTDDFSFHLTHSKSKLAHYYFLKSKAYATSGKEAIEYLEKALICLEEDLELLTLVEERISCTSTIAMEYSMLGDFKKSADSFLKVISSDGFRNFAARNSVIFNYCTTLLKLKEYKSALAYLNELENLDVEPIVKERIYTMKCNCYIFMEDVNGIKKILPKNLQSYDISVRAYYRFLYLIYFLIKQEYELAQRELVNIKNMKGFEKTDYLPLHHLFVRYIDALNAVMYNEKQAAKKISLLQDEVNAFSANHGAVAQLLPGMWILEKIDQLLFRLN